MAPRDATDARAQMKRWNKPPENRNFEMVVGVPVTEGDGRATDHLDPDNAGIVGADTPPSGGGEGSYDEWAFQELKDEIDNRNADRGDADKISKGGSADDLRARLEEDDDEDSDEE